jgi:hypothetical protein
VLYSPRENYHSNMARAYYSANAAEFISYPSESILGELVTASTFDVTTSQRQAWISEIEILKSLAKEFRDAHFFLEFSIPRMGRRADAVVLYKRTVFVIEFKVGASNFTRFAEDQVLGYALDLKNFHETSHTLPIIPVLLATEAHGAEQSLHWYHDDVAVPLRIGQDGFHRVLQHAVGTGELDARAWESGRYKPTPTIIEAAQALYRNHSVDDITRSEAGVDNLTATAAFIEGVIDDSKRRSRKAVCLVTGVPGAGKTLAGLNIANLRMRSHDDEHAVFLSGNGPLVDVLREALTCDAMERGQVAGFHKSKAEYKVNVSAFIQNIHHFRDEALQSQNPMAGKVAVFDEAQRAWNREQTSKFMREKRGQVGFSDSEPEFLLGVLDRSPDWCVLVCLIGEGQEINTGEAGIHGWLDALNDRFNHWDVYYSNHLLGEEFLPTDVASQLSDRAHAYDSPALHLAVSIRSFRAERLADFVSAVIRGHSARAAQTLGELNNYPLVQTRDLEKARAWIGAKRRGTERAGILASSNALRLKPYGIFVRAKADPAVWFLAPRGDVRSSDALEDVATEFEVQGLELDWACVCWDANLRCTVSGWAPFQFKGTKWQRVSEGPRTAYLLNTYRVLLTRARQGMVIFVPRGSDADGTRPAEIYDGIAAFLGNCGIPEI